MSINPAKLAEDPARSRLGRGLAALIGDMAAETSVDRPSRGQRRLPTAALRPNPRNPRRTFHDAELDELVASLRERLSALGVVIASGDEGRQILTR